MPSRARRLPPTYSVPLSVLLPCVAAIFQLSKVSSLHSHMVVRFKSETTLTVCFVCLETRRVYPPMAKPEAAHWHHQPACFSAEAVVTPPPIFWKLHFSYFEGVLTEKPAPGADCLHVFCFISAGFISSSKVKPVPLFCSVTHLAQYPLPPPK